MQAALAGVVAGAKGGEHGGFGKRERDHLLHDAQDQFGAALDGELLEQPIHVHMNGVR